MTCNRESLDYVERPCTTYSEQTLSMDLEIAEDAILVVSDILSEIVAPGVYAIIDALSESRLGVSFIRAVEKHPKEAYEVLITVLHNEFFLEFTERMMRKELMNRYNIRVPHGVLLKLKDGDNSAFMQMVSLIYNKLRTQRQM